MSHLDELGSLLHGAFAAQVGHAVFRNHGIHEVAGVVDVRTERHDAADGTALGSGTASEDAQVGVVREVGRTADAVHHFRAANLRGVHVSVNVGLDGGVQRADADAGDDFRAVGNFRRAEHQLVFEEIHVIINTVQAFVGHGQRAG